ncbi:right-handed parallel beta-helix repeat-containing protein (plasmid) [Azospirillum humicireducens]|uniref:Right-handed parallel beta-helix repeat-containing protein n=1 Tax=Azospirillum humicireducens TaxID=1226968 RepID=A0A2R4VXS9_9PROT|nr:right-handed parallel beta-helix repeat-containing protein [Azospirillum humicireducens]AWB09201.1 right-handed parallel beta-helix repeat-containing protein [Azospirillum humicireducens]
MTTTDQTAFFVSTKGNDSWSGRLAAPNAAGTDGPFASLEKARDAMRSSDIDSTYVRGGTYRLDETLTLDARDSGHNFLAYNSETPVLSGGERVTGFVSEGKGLYSAKLSLANGLDVSIGGVRQHAAQTGNHAPSEPATSGWHVLKADSTGASKTSFNFSAGDIPSGLKPHAGLVVQTFDTERLKDDISHVKSIDQYHHTVTLDDAASYGLRTGGTYRVMNDASLIRDAGEFGWRAGDGRLVVKPEDPGSFQSDGVVVARLGSLIKTSNASNLSIEGLTFSDARYDGSAISMQGGRGNSVGGNHFVNVGTAVALDGTDNSRIAGNHMEQLGGNGVSMIHAANGNRIYANTIEHIGQITKGGAGIGAVGSSNTLVSNNDISDAPRYGVSFKEWDDGQLNRNNTVEFNRIHHVGQETADGGGIEMLGRSAAKMGSVIRGNEIIDTGGLATDGKGNWLTDHKGWGISLDDLTSGVIVRDNLVKGFAWAGIYVHGGDDNLLENNFGVASHPQDAFIRLEWVPKAGDEARPHDNTVINNLAAGDMPIEQYWKLLSPGRLIMDGNLAANGRAYGPNDAVFNPGFTDSARGDYSLKEDAAALSHGIHDLSWSSMGVEGYQAGVSMIQFWDHAA